MDIQEIVEQVTGARPNRLTPLSGGQESTAIRCGFADRDDLVMLVSPDWRTGEELAWAHAVCWHAARSLRDDVADIALFVRRRRQESIRRTLAIGCPIDHPYAQNQIRIFRNTVAGAR